MGGGEIAKDAIRIVTTAGLSKDVIDLLKEKISLLAEQNATLEKENVVLKLKLYDLEQELTNLKPKTRRFEQGTERLLKLLFRHDEMTVSEAANYIGCTHGMADYHRGVLMDAKMAAWTSVGIQTDFGQSDGAFCITQEGRAYAVRHGLAT